MARRHRRPSRSSAAPPWSGGPSPQKFVCYPISSAHAERGEALINWICRSPHGRRRRAAARGLEQAGQARATSCPRSRTGTSAGSTCRRDPRRAHHPANTRWSTAIRCRAGAMAASRCSGDAAHPMYPIGSNGASQAIIDGEAITQELMAGDDPEMALQRYEAAPPAADGAHRREQPAQGHRHHARHRRGARAAGLQEPRKRAAGRPSSNASSATTRSWWRRTARRFSAGGRMRQKKTGPSRDRPWRRFTPAITSPAATEREYGI